jgi:twitching motility protein PilT
MEFQGVLESCINYMWQRQATDLLLTMGMKPTVRINGDLEQIEPAPAIDRDLMTDMLTQCLNEDQRKRLMTQLEVDFALSWHDVARMRGNAFYQRGMPTVALRMIPKAIPSFDELGLPVAVRELAKLPQGLVLFTGPTGSGKSTTMASLIDWINNNRPCHIITIEDPIEYVHDHKRSLLSQREVGIDALSFERALRSALREDPDVVLVGEMRDSESMSITLTLAETGHLVFSTLHTNDAAQTIDRIIDSYSGDQQPQVRTQLAGVLRAVIAQRLVPRKSGGLVAVFEVMIANSAVSNLVREGKTRQLRNAIQMAQASGNSTLEMSLNHLVATDVIDYDTALATAFVPQEIAPPPLPLPAPIQTTTVTV